MGWHHDLFLSILTVFPPLDQACHLYIMSVISNYNCMQRDFLGHGGGTHLKKYISIISLIGETVFSTNIYKLVLAQREKHFQG